jgi:hypothetical protein
MEALASAAGSLFWPSAIFGRISALSGLHGAEGAAWRARRVLVALHRAQGRQVLRYGADRRLAAFRDWRPKLSPGERAIVLLVAADREQAKILHRYCQGILSPPILQSLVWNVTASEIELHGRVTIEVVTRSYRTIRGRSVCVAILDELAFWRDDDSANPDSEVLNAVRASMATFGSDAMVIAGSSPYARRGVLWDAFRRWFGKDDARNLVWRAATRTMNPTVIAGIYRQ